MHRASLFVLKASFLQVLGRILREPREGVAGESPSPSAPVEQDVAGTSSDGNCFTRRLNRKEKSRASQSEHEPGLRDPGLVLVSWCP